MADVREVFPVLIDGSDEGVALSEAQAGQVAAGKVGLVGFGFRDASGNLVLPQLTSDGKISVDTESFAGTKLSDRGENAGSLTEVAIASITLTASEIYEELEVVVSSRRTSLFQVVFDDNGSETILLDMIVDAGQFTIPVSLKNLQFTAGATGAQTLEVRGINLQNVSTMRASVAIKQRAAS